MLAAQELGPQNIRIMGWRWRRRLDGMVFAYIHRHGQDGQNSHNGLGDRPKACHQWNISTGSAS
jgi:hypothetical protein